MPQFEYEVFIPQMVSTNLEQSIDFLEAAGREMYPSLHSNGSMYRKFNNLEEAKEFAQQQERLSSHISQ